MSKIDILMELYQEEDILIADGFDSAIIGIEESSMRVIYSVGKCIDILRTKEGMSIEDALDYFAFNVQGAYVGDKTPIWCADIN